MCHQICFDLTLLAGANYPKYQPQPTSYDYDAPLSESGRYHPEKFVAIRDLLSVVCFKVSFFVFYCVVLSHCVVLNNCPLTRF